MACDSGRLETKHQEQTKGTHRYGADGGLRNVCDAQSSFLIRFRFIVEGGMGINDITQPLAGPGQAVQHLGELTGQVPEHSHILRALAREQKGQRSLRSSGAVERPVGCGPRALVRMTLQKSDRALETFPETGGLHGQDQTVRGLRAERGAGPRRQGA